MNSNKWSWKKTFTNAILCEKNRKDWGHRDCLRYLALLHCSLPVVVAAQLPAADLADPRLHLPDSAAAAAPQHRVHLAPLPQHPLRSPPRPPRPPPLLPR